LTATSDDDHSGLAMIGQSIGPYQILAELGRGGMGEVYRARDTKLNREVAIKVLPAAFALDANRLARFTREAQMLASLNHPNIAGIYGIETHSASSGQANAIVMELVEGQDLSEMIFDGPAIQLSDAIAIARQIAEALEAAHEQGMVHRDLKPHNIKVRADGTVKVLDFGLAKAVDPSMSGITANRPTAPGHFPLSAAPTMTSPAMTAMGMVLGTAAYMSPEQATGKFVDRRADIWAFGVVLYEMLTRRRAFDGDDMSDLLVAVLTKDVDWSALPAETPASIVALIRRCLTRDPKLRLRDIGEARVTLANPGPSGAAVIRESPRVAIGLNGMTAALVLTAAALTALGVIYLRPPAASSDSRAVFLPFDAPEAVISEAGSATISPDGRMMAFSGRGSDGRRVLWVRALDSMEARPLPDTDDAIEPFWSWDSKSIAFGAQGKLKRLDLGANRATALTDAARSNNGSWNRSGIIVFSPDYGSPLYSVAATGGTRTQVTRDGSHRYPVFLPDGKRFLYSAGSKVMVGSLDSQEPREIPVTGPAIYAPPGWLLYVRGGVIVAHAFDADSLELSGDPVTIAPASTWGQTRLSVSDSGILAFAPPRAYDYQLAWFDRTGAPAGTLGPVVNAISFQHPRISPDGTRVAVHIVDPRADGTRDLWVGDVVRGTFERLTSTPSEEQNPTWATDSRSMYANAPWEDHSSSVIRIPVGGGTQDFIVSEPGTTVSPSDVTRDGRWLFYQQRGKNTRVDVWALPLTDGLVAKDAKPVPVITSEFDDAAVSVSPNGQWLAYDADVTGTREVYMRRFTDGRAGPSVRVTFGHGTMARWSHDGSTLFYVRAPQGYLSAEMMALPITFSGDRIDFGTARPVFKARMFPTLGTTTLRDYDVAPDGRFLVGTVVGPSKGAVATVVLNWTSVVTNPAK
jgi:Tol biopolymer transport system component